MESVKIWKQRVKISEGIMKNITDIPREVKAVEAPGKISRLNGTKVAIFVNDRDKRR